LLQRTLAWICFLCLLHGLLRVNILGKENRQDLCSMPWSFQQYLAWIIALHCTPKNQALFLSPRIRDLCNTSVINTAISLSVIAHLAQTNHEFNASSREEAIPIAKPPPLVPAGSRAASPRKQLHSSCPSQPPYPAIWLHDERGACSTEYHQRFCPRTDY
jgi:hypothetical protein